MNESNMNELDMNELDMNESNMNMDFSNVDISNIDISRYSDKLELEKQKYLNGFPETPLHLILTTILNNIYNNQIGILTQSLTFKYSRFSNLCLYLFEKWNLDKKDIESVCILGITMDLTNELSEILFDLPAFMNNLKRNMNGNVFQSFHQVYGVNKIQLLILYGISVALSKLNKITEQLKRNNTQHFSYYFKVWNILQNKIISEINIIQNNTCDENDGNDENDENDGNDVNDGNEGLRLLTEFQDENNSNHILERRRIISQIKSTKNREKFGLCFQSIYLIKIHQLGIIPDDNKLKEIKEIGNRFYDRLNC